MYRNIVTKLQRINELGRLAGCKELGLPQKAEIERSDSPISLSRPFGQDEAVGAFLSNDWAKVAKDE